MMNKSHLLQTELLRVGQPCRYIYTSHLHGLYYNQHNLSYIILNYLPITFPPPYHKQHYHLLYHEERMMLFKKFLKMVLTLPWIRLSNQQEGVLPTIRNIYKRLFLQEKRIYTWVQMFRD